MGAGWLASGPQGSALGRVGGRDGCPHRVLCACVLGPLGGNLGCRVEVSRSLPGRGRELAKVGSLEDLRN